MNTCSCGCAAAHIVARRETADGHPACLWSDGSWTWGALGRVIPGSPARPADSDVAAGWLVAGEIALFDAEELPTLIRTARRLSARRPMRPANLRAAMAPRGLRAIWETLESDRDGRPVVAVWRLPRLVASGLAVWRDRGRYRVMREIQRSGSYEAAGSWLASMRAVRAELEALGVFGV